MFRSIVVPVDLADLEFARFALDKAMEIARFSGGKVTLVNVVPVMPVMMLDTVPVTYEAEVADKAKETLLDLASKLPLPADRVEVAVRIGGVNHEILAAAQEAHADLVLVGSHMPALSTYLLGSNATSIVRHATCSVLVLRHANEPAERAEAAA